jgi:transposase
MTACVLLRKAAGHEQQAMRHFGTMPRNVWELAAWLPSDPVTPMALASTGVYGKPVWNLLAGQCEVVWVNAQHLKAVPGRKTDLQDCQWSADLVPHGWRRGSFGPPPPIRRVRARTRLRPRLRQDQTTVAHRRQQILADATSTAWLKFVASYAASGLLPYVHLKGLAIV